ncbi:uncharacterized protein LOC143253630 [Tachypleus tridentatus]|uniref:uncharacterized protein LOC143253630 n=1 Tax=Tachypleus tridentatus TaxID=6853 RepID=UPI003FD510A0
MFPEIILAATTFFRVFVFLWLLQINTQRLIGNLRKSALKKWTTEFRNSLFFIGNILYLLLWFCEFSVLTVFILTERWIPLFTTSIDLCTVQLIGVTLLSCLYLGISLNLLTEPLVQLASNFKGIRHRTIKILLNTCVAFVAVSTASVKTAHLAWAYEEETLKTGVLIFGPLGKLSTTWNWQIESLICRVLISKSDVLKDVFVSVPYLMYILTVVLLRFCIKERTRSSVSLLCEPEKGEKMASDRISYLICDNEVNQQNWINRLSHSIAVWIVLGRPLVMVLASSYLEGNYYDLFTHVLLTFTTISPIIISLEKIFVKK